MSVLAITFEYNSDLSHKLSYTSSSIQYEHAQLPLCITQIYPTSSSVQCEHDNYL